MRRAVLLALLLALAACGVDGAPEPVPGGVVREGSRIGFVGVL